MNPTPCQQMAKAAHWKLSEQEIDAILAVFKGLPAMQEEDMAANWQKTRAYTRNALRRQILAELENGK